MSARDWIVLAAVLLGAGLALFFTLRRKKGCGCGCSSCGCCDCCKKGTDKPDKL